MMQVAILNDCPMMQEGLRKQFAMVSPRMVTDVKSALLAVASMNVDVLVVAPNFIDLISEIKSRVKTRIAVAKRTVLDSTHVADADLIIEISESPVKIERMLRDLISSSTNKMYLDSVDHHLYFRGYKSVASFTDGPKLQFIRTIIALEENGKQPSIDKVQRLLSKGVSVHQLIKEVNQDLGHVEFYSSERGHILRRIIEGQL